MKLTDTFVKRRQGNGKVQKHSDGGGLFLYITPEGKKSWRLAYRFMGKQKLLVIGPYPEISLKDARDKGTTGIGLNASLPIRNATAYAPRIITLNTCQSAGK